MSEASEAAPGATAPTGPRTNWAGNYTYRALTLHAPRSIEDLGELVRAGGGSLRVLGTRHSFNAIADTAEGAQISLEHFTAIAWAEEGSAVLVGAGVTYARLARWLEERGYAVENLASLPHISIAGAVQTGTHGSGMGNGGLATAVTGLEMMGPDGVLRWFAREVQGELFEGMVVALGMLGIVTRLRLRVVPSFMVRQTVYEGLPFATLCENFDSIFGAGYSVSLFTHWDEPRVTQAWVKQRVESNTTAAPVALFGAPAAEGARHPLPRHAALHCTPQMGVPGPWYERLPHFRSDYTPSSGEEIQSEYFVPLEQGPAAVAALAAIGSEIAPHLFVSEMRVISADALWLSPCFARASVALHFTWIPDAEVVARLLPKVEAALAPFKPRPHWGKVFTMPPAQVRALYPHAPQFCALARELDPGQRFRNAFVARYLFGEEG